MLQMSLKSWHQYYKKIWKIKLKLPYIFYLYDVFSDLSGNCTEKREGKPRRDAPWIKKKKKKNLYFNPKSLHLSCEFSHNSYNNLVVGSTTAHTCRGTKRMHMFGASFFFCFARVSMKIHWTHAKQQRVQVKESSTAQTALLRPQRLLQASPDGGNGWLPRSFGKWQFFGISKQQSAPSINTNPVEQVVCATLTSPTPHRSSGCLHTRTPTNSHGGLEKLGAVIFAACSLDSNADIFYPHAAGTRRSVWNGQNHITLMLVLLTHTK